MLQKRYLADDKTCKVTFTTHQDGTHQASEVTLVGDFNHWDETATPMKRLKNGSFTAVLKLKRGESYEFRYLVDGNSWLNDWDADDYHPTHYGDCDNSIVRVTAAV